MNNLLGFKTEELEKLGCIHTATEIYQQPDAWRRTFQKIKGNYPLIQKFLKKPLSEEGLRIILSGAGSSSFVGECAQIYLNKFLDGKVECIPTTDIVSKPKDFLYKGKPTLMISFARSGNSPESIAAVELGNQLVDNIYHIIITCNGDGKLARMCDSETRSLVLIMPEETNDKGFAMTSSFTSMLLAVLLIFTKGGPDGVLDSIESIVKASKNILDNRYEVIKDLAEKDFNRVVYLGTGCLLPLAKESCLKILELTSGQITTLYDTPMGFRHGPKSFINTDTIVIMFLSNDQQTNKYEIDLFNELNNDGISTNVTIGDYPPSNKNYDEDVFSIFSYLLYAQMFSFYKSILLGVTPDNPNPKGLVNRVVKGVKIYPFLP